jgi:ornithine cyclodeaminase
MTDAMLPWISSEEVFERVGIDKAIRVVQRELEAGLVPANDLRRSIRNVEHGQLLMMPSQSPEFVGIKIAGVAPGNSALGRERIQGIYLLMDAATLSPIAFIDGPALTTLRTSAVSAAIADHLAPSRVDHLVVFGCGPQARGHIEAMRAIRSIRQITIIARDHGRAATLASRIASNELDARVGKPDEVRGAQLIVCATTARFPLFDGSLVPDDSLSVAVGSHEADARELDSVLIARAQLVVEDTSVALREAGDLIIPLNEDVIKAASLVPMRDIITGVTAVDHQRPRVFKSSGMSWEDLVIATEIFRTI